MMRNHLLSKLFSLSVTIMMMATTTINIIHVHGFAPKPSHRDLRKHSTTSLPYHTSADPEAISIPDVFLGCNFHLNSNNGLKQLESIILPTTDAAVPSSFSNNNNNSNNKPISTTTKVRFHFVRHGESLANKSNKIAGQTDVPLTSHGLEEAKLLGQASPWLTHNHQQQKEKKNTDNDDSDDSSSSFNWWRMYSSDLSRAKNTALMALQQQSHVIPPPPIIEDQRLRERSYGIRQGFPRSMSKNEILASRQAQGLTELPPYETNIQLWERAKEWMLDALHEVKQVQTLEQHLSSPYYPSDADVDVDVDVEYNNNNNNKVYNIFVAAHAGLIREILMNLIPNKDLVELGGKFDYSNNRNKLVIPNTSMSVIEMDPFYDDDEPIQQDNVNVIDLLNSDHLHKVNIYDD